MNHLLAFALSEVQILIILVIGILLFGRKLPEIGRSLGKGIVEFKKGLKGMEEEVHDTGSPHVSSAPQQPAIDQPRPPQRVTASAPKFEEPAAPKFQDAAPRFEAPAHPKFEEKPHDTTPTPPQG